MKTILILIAFLFSRPAHGEPIWLGPQRVFKQAIEQVVSSVPRGNKNTREAVISSSARTTRNKTTTTTTTSKTAAEAAAATTSNSKIPIRVISKTAKSSSPMVAQVEQDLLETNNRTSEVGGVTTARQSKPAAPSAMYRGAHSPKSSSHHRVGRKVPKGNKNLLAGAIAAVRQNPHLVAKWCQVGIGVYLGHAIFQAAREVLQDFEDASNGGAGAVLKPQAVSHVLQEIQEQKQPTDHHRLYRIASWLQTVTGWQLFDDPDQSKPSLASFLLSLTRNEFSILDQCLYIPTSTANVWDQIHGIPDIQQAILDRLQAARVCPRHNPYASILQDNHAGVLLYGPPGCGKTMLLQAVCSTIRSPCLILTPSVLLKKYVGETNQLIRSLFTLAEKMGDCVIVLDELDGLFRERRPDEHETSRELKTEFLQWWDGIVGNNRILFVGATNRPFDVDAAILRRMSQAHFIGLPMGPARSLILQKLLAQIPHSEQIDPHQLALATEGFSPSDLVQLVRTAVQQGPLRESRGTSHGHFRALQHNDLVQARQTMGPTPLSQQYRNSLIQFHQQQKQQPPQQQQLPPPQQQQQPMAGGVQSTPWGTFYHAGTVTVDDYQQQEEGESSMGEDNKPLEDSLEDSLEDAIDDELDDFLEDRPLQDDEWDDYDSD